MPYIAIPIMHIFLQEYIPLIAPAKSEHKLNKRILIAIVEIINVL